MVILLALEVNKSYTFIILGYIYTYMTKKELKELIKEVINEETQSVDPEEILGEILELTTSDTRGIQLTQLPCSENTG